jgi:hypothetical protein
MGVAELNLDHAKRMRTLARAALRLSIYSFNWPGALCSCPAPGACPISYPHASSCWPWHRALVRALVEIIGEDDGLVAPQRAIALDPLVDIGRHAANRMHQPGVGIDPEGSLPCEVPLVARSGLMHLGFALPRRVLDQTRRCNQCGASIRLPRSTYDRTCTRRNANMLGAHEKKGRILRPFQGMEIASDSYFAPDSSQASKRRAHQKQAARLWHVNRRLRT